jgi:hypothetical protein
LVKIQKRIIEGTLKLYTTTNFRKPGIDCLATVIVALDVQYPINDPLTSGCNGGSNQHPGSNMMLVLKISIARILLFLQYDVCFLSLLVLEGTNRCHIDYLLL